jgi:hypothetical protein
MESITLTPKLAGVLVEAFERRKDPDQSVTNESSLFQSLPRFDRIQCNAVRLCCVTTPSPFRALFHGDVHFDYLFDRAVLQSLSSSSDDIPDRFLVLLFQLLSRLFVDDTLINSDDFMLFLTVLAGPPRPYSALLFYLLLSGAFANPQFEWPPSAIGGVVAIFSASSQVLGPEFHQFLVFLLRFVLLQTETMTSSELSLLQMIWTLYRNQQKIVTQLRADDHFELIDAIQGIYDILPLNRFAVLILAFVTQYAELADLDGFVEQVSRIFPLEVERMWQKFDPEPPETLHDLPASFSSDVLNADDSYTETATFSPLPIELEVSGAELFDAMPADVNSCVNLHREFLEGLSPRCQKCAITALFESLQAYNVPVWYRVTVALFALLERLHRPAFFDVFIENVTSPIIFNLSRSVFGPIRLSPFLNRFRACAIDLMAAQGPDIFVRLLVENRSSHFLVSEIIGRLSLRSPFVLDILNTPEIVGIVTDALVAIRKIGAPFAARTPLFHFFTELLTHEKTSLVCLSSDFFLQSFGRLLSEPSVIKPLLSVLERAVSRMDETTKINSLIQFFERTDFGTEIRESILELIGERLFLASAFERFLPIFMQAIGNNPTETGLNHALQLLRTVCASRSNFTLSTTYFKIFAPHVSPSCYAILISLVAGGYTVGSGAFFLINNPSFLPLALISIASDADACTRFFEICLSFGEFSTHNVRMLHVGDIDSILLLALTTGAVYKGFRFVLTVNRALVLNLLTLISSVVSDHSIVKKYVCNIKYPDIRKVFFTVLSQSLHSLPNQFSIGNLSTAYRGAKIPAVELSNSFAIGFWLKNDSSVLCGVPSKLPLVRLTDSKKNVLTVFLIHGSQFAKYEGSTEHVQVSLVQHTFPNAWTHFTFIFPGQNQRQKIVVLTFKNGIRSHTSEFGNMTFSGPMEVEICSQNEVGELEFGRIAQIFICKDHPTFDGICSAMYDQNSPIPGELFSSMRLPKDAFLRTVDVVSLQNAFSSPSLLRKIVQAYLDCRDNILLGILWSVIEKSTDKHLPGMFRSLTEPPIALYSIFYQLTVRIEDSDTQLVWFEEILINGNMWGWQHVSIVKHWNCILISTFRSFFERKSYFSYFLQNFEVLIDDAVLFLKRIGLLRLETGDVDALFYALTESKQILVLLSIIRDLAVIIRRLNYDKITILLQFLRNEDLNIRMLALDSFHALLDSAFYSRIWAILHNVDDPLVELIEERIPDSPSLFSLNCAFALLHPSVQLSVFPEIIPTHKYWFLFPVLLMVYTVGEIQSKLISLIAKSIFQADRDDASRILSLTARFSKNAGHREATVLHALLVSMAEFSSSANPAHLEVLLCHIICAFLFPFEPQRYTESLLQLFSKEDQISFFVPPKHETALPRPTFANLPILLQQTVDLSGLAFQIKLEGDKPLLKYHNLIDAGRKVFDAMKQKLSVVPSRLEIEWEFVCSFGATVDAKRRFFENCAFVEAVLGQCQNDLQAWNEEGDRFISGMLRDFLAGSNIPIVKWTSKNRLISMVPDQIPEVYVTRSHFLTNSVPWNVMRVKDGFKDAVESQPSSGIEVVLHGKHFPVGVTIDQGFMTIQGDRYSRNFLLTDVSELIVTENGQTAGYSIELIADNIPILLLAPVENRLTTRTDFGKRLFPELKIDASRVDRRRAYINDLQRKWVAGFSSSFKYLSLLNALSGHSYENSCENYPFFPSVKVTDFSTCPCNVYFPIDGSFLNERPESPPLPQTLFVMPEYYFLAGGGRTPATVYQNRKDLEAREDLHVWITRASDPDLPFPLPFGKTPHPPRVGFQPLGIPGTIFQLTDNDSITFCVPLKDDHRHRFRFVSSKGIISIVGLIQKANEWSLNSPVIWPVGFDMTREGTFSSTSRELIRVGRRDVVVVNSTAYPIVTQLRLHSFELSEDCCQLSFTELGTFRIGKDVTVVPFAIVPERILCFARSRKFNITAIGCQDCALRIRSNETGLKVATVSLGDEVPIRVMITKSWGFIVVKTIESLFVFTVNGLIVQKIEDKSGWGNWFNFRTRDGVDFIGLNMEDGTLKYFEVGEPRNTTILSVRGIALGWTYLWRQDAFCIIFERSEMIILPRSTKP